MDKLEYISKEWLDENLLGDSEDHWYINITTNETRPITVMVFNSSEIKDGWCIALWDEADEFVIYEGKDYTIERFKQLCFVLSGETFEESAEYVKKHKTDEYNFNNLLQKYKLE